MKTIVAVDDDQDLLQLLGDVLRTHELRLVPVNRVNGALDRIKETRPDYLMLDVMLPDGAGYQVARAVRGDPCLYQTPILFVSALGEPPEVTHAMRQGGDAYLTKPFSLSQFFDRLRTLDILSERIRMPDSGTGLLHVETIEREIDLHTIRHEPFALGYFTIANFAGFQKSRTADRAQEVISWTGHMLQHSLRESEIAEGRIAHLSSDHFIVFLHPDHCRPYCKLVTAKFNDQIKQFYRGFELEQKYTVTTPKDGVYEGAKLMRLHILLFESNKHEFENSRDILKSFQKALTNQEEEKSGSVFRYNQGAKW